MKSEHHQPEGEGQQPGAGKHHEGHTCEHHDGHGVAKPSAAAYFCPMCPGVESDKPGTCPKCGMALERNPAVPLAGKTIYTCPMHPQIEQDHPGNCPICGMALEPKTATAAPEDDTELRDMTRRLWIGGALALPVFVLAMAHLVPALAHVANGTASRWVQFLLSAPVVWWA
ncbi:MAG: heavy metal-binding domain-containing protein, partial [Opitutaceae bacterium]